jgi:hypothetical protein
MFKRAPSKHNVDIKIVVLIYVYYIHTLEVLLIVPVV